MELNDSSLKDRLIFVREDREEAGVDVGLAQAVTGDAGQRVYVGNLSWDASWQDLKDHMRGANQDLNVLHADIMLEPNGKKSTRLALSPCCLDLPNA